MAMRPGLLLALYSVARGISPPRACAHADDLPLPPAPAAVVAALQTHDRAVFVKTGSIRDPYVILASNGFYYLTGTTPLADDRREQADALNTGLGHASIVGRLRRVVPAPK
jgi:arylsulfatase